MAQADTWNLRVYYGLFYGGVKPSSILMSCDSPCSSGNRIYNYLLFFGGTSAVFFFPSALIASVRNTHKSQPRTLWPVWNRRGCFTKSENNKDEPGNCINQCRSFRSTFCLKSKAFYCCFRSRLFCLLPLPWGDK